MTGQVYLDRHRLGLGGEQGLKEITVTTGKIKKVLSDRGFGFISAEDGKDYYFHRDGLTPSLDFDLLTGGEMVEFQIEQSPKGVRATRIGAMDYAPPPGPPNIPDEPR